MIDRRSSGARKGNQREKGKCKTQEGRLATEDGGGIEYRISNKECRITK